MQINVIINKKGLDLFNFARTVLVLIKYIIWTAKKTSVHNFTV